MKYGPLLLYHGPSVADCCVFLAEDPHPRWEGPPGWGDPVIEHVSGPFRIVPAFLDNDESESWCIVAEHDTEAVRPCVSLPYGCMDNDQLLSDYGLPCAISAAIRQFIGVTDEVLESKCVAEIGRLYREEALLYEADAIEYGKG